MSVLLPRAAARRPRYTTVGDCLRHSAEVAPANGVTAYTRKADGEPTPYPQLLARSEAFARHLLDRGVEPGALVGLALPTSVEFFIAFFGCQLARAAAVTLSLPVRVGSLRDRGAERLRRTVRESRLQVLVDGLGLNAAELDLPEVEVLRWTDWEEEEAAGGGSVTALPRARPEDLGLVQFTSGSVSRPKGVCLTQGNISFNIQAIVEAVDMNRGDTIDLWIPLYHDMGLMGSLTAIASQGNLRLCNPLHFLIDPLGWLLRFAERGSTINPSPHFFFRMLNEAYDAGRAADLDLSRWRVAFNGAEPIRAADLDRFQDSYGPHGFPRTTMYPVYGLAESTLAALFPTYGREPRVVRGDEVFGDRAEPWLGAKLFVSVGRPLTGHEARIDPLPESSGLDLPPEIGELKVRGPSITAGYLHRPRETVEALDAEGWLATRDLAFRHDGEHFICGRLKEIIIVHGENYFPEDFEALVDRMQDGPPTLGARAAFPHDTEAGEVVAIAVEVKPPPRSVPADAAEAQRARFVQRLRGQCADHFGIDLMVFLLAPRTIPHTTSGKLRRLELARRLESGEVVPLEVTVAAELR